MGVPDALVRDAVEHLDSELAILEPDGRIVYTNESWRTFAAEGGIDDNQAMLGENYLEACERSRPDDYADEAVEGLRKLANDKSEQFQFEYPCPSPTESFRWFLMWATKFTYEGTNYLLVEHIDITDRKRAERQVRERNETLSSVASILSHDLRNPLSAALAWAEILEQSAEGEAAERLVTALERMDAMMDDAVTLTRETTVEELEPVELSDAAEQAWSVSDAPDATLDVVSSATFEADRSLLLTILENLLRNGVDHAGPAVRLRVGALESAGFFVEDDGPGIPEDERDAVFESGHSSHSTDENTGLGLAIVKGAVNSHEWEIAVAEGELGGARFEITGLGSFEG